MDRFPALRLILRYGRLAAAVLSLLVTVATVYLLWPPLGVFALLTMPFVLPFVYYLVKSYVELVQIVTEMVH